VKSQGQRVQGGRFRDHGLWVMGCGLWFIGLKFRVQGLGFIVGFGFKV
jgi:hypothetical protein